MGTENAIPNAFGSTPTVQALPPPLSSGKALRSSVTPETPSRRRDLLGDVGRERLADDVGDDELRGQRLADGGVGARRGRAAEDRHHRHQGQPDHQGTGGGAGAARVAQGVLGGQPTDRPERAAVDRAEQVQHRLPEEGAHQAHADEDEQDAAADARSGPALPSPVEPDRHRAPRPRSTSTVPISTRRRSGRLGQGDVVAQRRDRRRSGRRGGRAGAPRRR